MLSVSVDQFFFLIQQDLDLIESGISQLKRHHRLRQIRSNASNTYTFNTNRIEEHGASKI